MRQQLGQLRAALAMFGKFELRSEQRGVGIYECRAVPFDQLLGRRFAVPLLQGRFVIEQLEVAGRAGHEKENNPFGLGREMRLLRPQRVRSGGCSPTAFAKELAQRDRAEPHAALLEKPAACDELRILTAIKMCLAVHVFKMTNDE